MPFGELIPHPFTTGAVRVYAPTTEGVYGISSAREWIFIGETENIQNALLAHLQDAGAALMKREPTGFTYESCAGPTRTVRLNRLVAEYKPTCNRSATPRS